jgi:GNAT superfamily N-acetyltransferase
MRLRVRIATARDMSSIVVLRIAVAGRLTAEHGHGHWSRLARAKGVQSDMQNSKLFVAYDGPRIIASLRLTRRKPWAIDPSYFAKSKRPIYLLSMAVLPELQRQGIGRQCLNWVREDCEHTADAIRLDVYDGPVGAGPFYAKCGFENVGCTVYRGVPLAYFELLLGAHNASPSHKII